MYTLWTSILHELLYYIAHTFYLVYHWQPEAPQCLKDGVYTGTSWSFIWQLHNLDSILGWCKWMFAWAALSSDCQKGSSFWGPVGREYSSRFVWFAMHGDGMGGLAANLKHSYSITMTKVRVCYKQLFLVITHGCLVYRKIPNYIINLL